MNITTPCIKILILAMAGSLSALAEPLPKVVILGTGGTIQSKGDTRMTRHDYRAGRFDISELIANLPELSGLADIQAVQYTNIGSSSMTGAVWLGLAKKINSMMQENPDIAGFVLTHGTNTLEETAYFLHLMVKTNRPVVLVGAQRPGTALSGDGPMNLYLAVRVAAHPDSAGKGVLIAMNQQINSAREGTKTSAYKLQAFQSRDFGLLGVADPDEVRYYRNPLRRHTLTSEFDPHHIAELPRVDVISTHAGAPGDLVTSAIEAGASGIVFSGHGAGGMSPAQREAAAKAVEAGAIVVACSRTGSGRVIEGTQFRETGIVAGDNLLPHKGRILLQLALASGLDRSGVVRVFQTY